MAALMPRASPSITVRRPMKNRPLPALLLSLTLLAGSARATAPDFAAAHQEVVERLQQFVRIDTSNPPGNETKAAEFLKAFLDKEGIPSEIVALDKFKSRMGAYEDYTGVHGR